MFYCLLLLKFVWTMRRCTKKSLYFKCGKTKKGGMKFPNAIETKATLSRSHWSSLLHSTLCNYPIRRLDGGNTGHIHIPYIAFIRAIPLNNIPKLLEKSLHICTVKACSSYQASSLRTSSLINKLGCLFMKPENQSGPLIPWLGRFDVLLHCKLICKLPDLKVEIVPVCIHTKNWS